VISFVGAGPGASDLLTLRGARRLATADVVVWASSLVSPAVLDHCRLDVELHDSKVMTLDEVTDVYAARPGAAIVRLHSGDPTLYGAIAEQIDWCVAHERAFEIVPGVSSLAAAAAAAGRELTAPGVSQSVVLTRLAHRTAASVPDGETVAGFARMGATMALFLSAGRPAELQAELEAAGSAYDATTPAVIAHRVSWPDERLVRTTIGRLADDLEALGASTTVLVLVGDALGVAEVPARSHVYDPGYAHSFRPARSGAGGGPSPESGASRE
jgi:precorrin-4/cobalt-precorrin-4 C11-methyltransferase